MVRLKRVLNLDFFGNQKKWQHFSTTRKNKVSYLVNSHCVRSKLLKRFLASSLFATICKLGEMQCTRYTRMIGMQRSKTKATTIRICTFMLSFIIQLFMFLPAMFQIKNTHARELVFREKKLQYLITFVTYNIGIYFSLFCTCSIGAVKLH